MLPRKIFELLHIAITILVRLFEHISDKFLLKFVSSNSNVLYLVIMMHFVRTI